MQVTITERNYWEGETFSYILDIDQETLDRLKRGLSENDNVRIEENTSYTKENIKPLNKAADNGYMERFDFYELKDLPSGDFKYYEDVIYKGIGLNRIE